MSESPRSEKSVPASPADAASGPGRAVLFKVVLGGIAVGVAAAYLFSTSLFPRGGRNAILSGPEIVVLVLPGSMAFVATSGMARALLQPERLRWLWMALVVFSLPAVGAGTFLVEGYILEWLKTRTAAESGFRLEREGVTALVGATMGSPLGLLLAGIGGKSRPVRTKG